MENPPRAFISYAWDTQEENDWVRTFATRLRSLGVDVTLDQWSAIPGDQLPQFMETSVRENDFVLVVCTPKYKEKSNKRIGGVGYEGDIMSAEVMNLGNKRKFIPILRRGKWNESAPSWLNGKYYVDLRGEPYAEERFNDLLTTLHRQRSGPPPLGPSPFPTKGLLGQTTTTSSPATDQQPIRILGIVADEVTQPRNDGSPGCALYAVPFKLSRQPSYQWSLLFEEVWKHPPSWTSMHRPNIAKVVGDRIILDGTTLEEVEKVHRETLKVVLREVNSRIEQLERHMTQQEQERQQQAQAHSKKVKDIASRMRFDDFE